jgi:hypothetical protein
MGKEKCQVRESEGQKGEERDVGDGRDGEIGRYKRVRYTLYARIGHSLV